LALPKKKIDYNSEPSDKNDGIEIDLSAPKDGFEIETSKIIESASLQQKTGEFQRPGTTPKQSTEQSTEPSEDLEATNAQAKSALEKSLQAALNTEKAKKEAAVLAREQAELYAAKLSPTKETAAAEQDSEKTDPELALPPKEDSTKSTRVRPRRTKVGQGIDAANTRFKEFWVIFKTLFNSDKNPFASIPEYEFKIPRSAKFILTLIALGLAGYGYAVHLQYEKGPYATWKQVVKSWKTGDYDTIRLKLDISIEETPVLLIERYPELIESDASRFGAILAKAHRLRLSAYEAEFKKGFGSAFWEFVPVEAIDMGDRVELVYGRGADRLSIFFEKRADEWKIVEIDGTKAGGLFMFKEEELLGEES
jgi:hypothetical protein